MSHVILRAYQTECILAVESALSKGENPLVALATGTGKTTIFCALTQRFVVRGERTLILAHTDELISQPIKRLYAQTGLLAAREQASHEVDLGLLPPIVIGTRQTVSRRLDKYPTDYFSRIIVDECVTGDTQVGGKRADQIKVGDDVDAWDGIRCVKRKVTHVFVNVASTLRTLRTARWRVTVTDAHPIWVRGKGYIDARDAKPGDVLMVQRPHSVREGDEAEGEDVRDGVPSPSSPEVDSPVHRVRHADSSGTKNVFRIVRESAGLGFNGENEPGARIEENEGKKPDASCLGSKEGVSLSSFDGPSPEDARRERAGAPYPTSASPSCARGWLGCGVCGCDERSPLGVPEPLQGRHCACCEPNCDRGRREQPLRHIEKSGGQEEGCLLDFERLESVEVHEPGVDGSFGGRAPESRVYNFEVEGEHNFFANGILTHNCHHAASSEYERIFGYFGGAARIGFTATPERSDKKGLAPWFSTVAYKMDTAQGIAKGWLSPPTIRTLRLTGWNTSDQKKTGKGKASDWSEETLELSFLAADLAKPVAQAIAEHTAKTATHARRQTIAFLPGVQASKKLTKELQALGLKAAHIDGTTPYSVRAILFDEFRSGSMDVLCNCAVLTEGFDAPETACVAMVRPTFSRSLFTQCVGRGLRLAKGKEDCLVLDFTLEGSVSLSVDPHKALFGAGELEPVERKERPSDLPPLEPKAMYPWANPEEAESYAFQFQATERVFFRGTFIAAHSLVSLVKGNPPPTDETAYTRTGDDWMSAVNLTLGEPSKYPPSEKQWTILSRIVPAFNLPELRHKVTGKTLDAVFQAEDARKKAGLCALSESWALWRFGFAPNVPKAFAKDLLSQVFEGKEGDYRLSSKTLEENITRAKETLSELFAFAEKTLAEKRETEPELPSSDPTGSSLPPEAGASVPSLSSSLAYPPSEDPWIELSAPL